MSNCSMCGAPLAPSGGASLCSRCQLLRPNLAKTVPGRLGSLPPEPATRPHLPAAQPPPLPLAEAFEAPTRPYPALPPEPPTNPDSSSNEAQTVPQLPPEPSTALNLDAPDLFHATPAAIWRRALALLVDVPLFLLACWPLLPDSEPLLSPLSVGLSSAFFLASSTVCARFFGGRTPGRYLAGIRLVDARGLPPSAGRAFGRALLSLVSALVFMGGFWLFLFDRYGQTLHDRWASTFVVQPA